MRPGRERDGGAAAADPPPAGRGRLCGGGGGAAWTRPELGWRWEVEGRPRSASAPAEGGDEAGPRRGSTDAKGKLCVGGARAAAQVRREGGGEGAEEAGSAGGSNPTLATFSRVVGPGHVTIKSQEATYVAS